MSRGRKISGGLYHKLRKKKLYQRSGQERKPVLGETKSKQLRIRAGRTKTVLLRSNIANILIKGKAQKASISNVVETPQNKFFARENRLLKGAIIDTSLGKARITNRPSQEGCINAILVE